jgi:ribosome biogenesis GTPase A
MSISHSFSHGRKHDTSMKSRSRTLKNIKRQRGKYPLLAEKIIQMSDIILEVLDARYIQETRNLEMEKQILQQGKRLIYVFNKADLINIQKIKEEEIAELTPKVFISCTTKKGIKELRNKIKITSYQIKEPVDKALHKVLVGVIGYPNTGKSSVISLLTGKNASGIGAEAGFTKGITKVNLTTEIAMLDSPGIIPNKEYSDSELHKLSKHTKLGARSSNQVREPEAVIVSLVKEYPLVFDKFYGTTAQGDSEMLIEQVGRKNHFLLRGNEIDGDRTARLIIKDWQKGKIRKD